MRILVLNYEYPPVGGGGASVCRDLAAGMAGAGHFVTVVTMGCPGIPSHEWRDGVEIYRLKCLRKHRSSCMPWEAYSYLLAAEYFLDRYLKTHSFDVCHTHFIFPVGPVAEHIWKKFGIPYIITVHGSDVEGYNRKLYLRAMHRMLRPVWKRAVRGAFAVVAPSEFLMGLLNRAMKSKRYVRIPNGLDPEKFKADRENKEKRILLMGRMQKAKNFQTVLRAVSMIPDNIWQDWQVDVLGDGPYRDRLEELCSEAGTGRRITFRGWIENGSPEQLDYLKKASIYISGSHFENCPVSVLEAVASGCYPLLSDIDGHRQFFPDDADRYFFPADDADALAGKLGGLLTGRIPEIEINISAYDRDEICRKYLRLLQKAAKAAKSRA